MEKFCEIGYFANDFGYTIQIEWFLSPERQKMITKNFGFVTAAILVVLYMCKCMGDISNNSKNIIFKLIRQNATLGT